MHQSKFKLPPEMYAKTRPRAFDVQEWKTPTYSAFLSIPLYFRRDGVGDHAWERKGEVFGALSYTNSNRKTFRNLTADKFIKYFALEMAVVGTSGFSDLQKL